MPNSENSSTASNPENFAEKFLPQVGKVLRGITIHRLQIQPPVGESLQRIELLNLCIADMK